MDLDTYIAEIKTMLKALVKKFIGQDHWSFVSWYKDRFGTSEAISAYFKLKKDQLGTAPNKLNGEYVYLRPGTADTVVYDEIFITQEYDIDLGDPLFIVDAGAHIGLSSVYFACKYPNATIVSIEPEPSNFQLLLKNVKKFTNIKPIQAGLWSRKTHLRIQNAGADTWSFRVIEDDSGNGIPAVSIDDIMQENNIECIDILKIDIEGSELEVLNKSDSWRNNIKHLIIELHDRFKPGCTEALEKAFSGYTFERMQSSESVVMKNIKKTHE